MTYLWLEVLRITWKELGNSLPSYGKLAIKYHGKRSKSVEIKSNTLGFTYQGQCQLSPERKQAICLILVPLAQPRFQEFFRATDFFRISIHNFLVLAKPLYDFTKWGEQEHLLLEQVQQRTFEEIRQALTNTTGLRLPDMSNPFFLYIHEHTCGSSNPDVGVIASCGGISLQAT